MALYTILTESNGSFPLGNKRILIIVFFQFECDVGHFKDKKEQLANTDCAQTCQIYSNSFSVGCVREPLGPPEASWFDFSTFEANGPITQIEVATYGMHTVG